MTSYRVEPPAGMGRAKQLHERHGAVSELLSTTSLNGLVGGSETIKRVNVTRPLTDDEKTAIEEWLGSEIVIDSEDE